MLALSLSPRCLEQARDVEGIRVQGRERLHHHFRRHSILETALLELNSEMAPHLGSAFDRI